MKYGNRAFVVEMGGLPKMLKTPYNPGMSGTGWYTRIGTNANRYANQE